MTEAEVLEACPPGFQFGRYQIESEVVQGPLGRLYRAHDTHLKTTVGLYVLAARFRDPSGVQQFRMWFGGAFYRHRGRFYDYGESDGVPFVTMEYTETADAALGLLSG